MDVKLTCLGIVEVNNFLQECQAMRKEILDAHKDTCNETDLPTMEDIICDIPYMLDIENDYINCWGVTDNYDNSIMLIHDIDFVFEN